VSFAHACRSTFERERGVEYAEKRRERPWRPEEASIAGVIALVDVIVVDRAANTAAEK